MLRRMRPASFLAAFCLSGSVVFAQGTPPAKPAAPVPPAAPAPAAAAAAGEKQEDEIKIPGVVLTRPDGRFLGVETDGVQLKVTFYDQEKKKETADAVRISARWNDTRPRFTVLVPAGAETLASPNVLKRPFNYIVYLALVGADEKVMETHSLRLQ
jgi:hypothetical protein